uniref:Uncharacterized protein LOC111116074 n=1 Tax=Crassostrea virginica TaxID=6565 RepID=A0A8B8C4Y9_CRAVI|nr:uncharacterized protein LOC111116074 [Crassostrea virginica]
MIEEECTECIGYFGINCGVPCLAGWFGPQCKLFCNCSENETCNPFVGCLSAKNLDSVCITNKTWSFEEEFNNCILWQLVVALLGIQVVAIFAFIGCSIRRKLKWRRKLEIYVTETAGHFRRRMDDSAADQTVEREERKSANYDGHLLRRKEANGDVYSRIHFKKVSTVQNSSDEYSVIMKQYKRLEENVIKPDDVIKTHHAPVSKSSTKDTQERKIYTLAKYREEKQLDLSG